MEITPLKIIFQDETILVIEKPAGMVVNRAKTAKNTLQDWIDNKFSFSVIPDRPKAGSGIYKNDGLCHPELVSGSISSIDSGSEAGMTKSQNQEFVDRVGLVHRLDKETSGLMVIAKNVSAFENLKNQFKQRQVLKKYLSLVHGKLTPIIGNIRAPIKRNPFNRMHFGVFVDGREAETNYKVLGYYQNPREKNKSKKYYSLVEVSPKTGRTHQIRVHFAHLHHPVVSDDLYGGRKTNRADRAWCPRLFLHAAYLEFNHPVGGQRLKFTSGLPPDLQQALVKRQKIPLEN